MKPDSVMNLRSDTQTLPTEAMLQATCSAPLGDDVSGEDATVNRLEQMAAAMLGKEAALLVVSGTMGNLVCLMAHAAPGNEVIVDANAHIYLSECGALASVAGLMPMLVSSADGMLDPGQVAAAIRKPSVQFPRPRVLCLENTHNRSGGMRQAGVIAAAGIVALETMIDRLAQDHANAKLLAAGLADIPGLRVNAEAVETNMVYVDHSETGLATDQVVGRFADAGVLVSGSPPDRVRFVTHRHYGSSDIHEAVRRARSALAV